MKLAVMQPYFLPYFGYFQLMASVDKFVVFDDVNYIQRGWINRNRLLLNGEAHVFTIPLSAASQNRRICDIEMTAGPWRGKLLKTIRQAYLNAPYFKPIFELCEKIINLKTLSLHEYLVFSLHQMAQQLKISTMIESSSRIYKNVELRGQQRILDICHREQADIYINAAGGTELYDSDVFEASNIQLAFLRPTDISYRQFGKPFVPNLSILDVLMFNSPESVSALLWKKDSLDSDPQ